jgi:hypothetical protein
VSNETVLHRRAIKDWLHHAGNSVEKGDWDAFAEAMAEAEKLMRQLAHHLLAVQRERDARN